MKKNILILAALIAVVLAVPFLIIKADEAIQIKNAEFKEKQNNVCYEKAGECMDAGEYDEAIELLENFREIMRMQNILSGMQSFAKLFRTKKELRSCINSYGIFRKRISTVVNMQKK